MARPFLAAHSRPFTPLFMRLVRATQVRRGPEHAAVSPAPFAALAFFAVPRDDVLPRSSMAHDATCASLGGVARRPFGLVALEPRVRDAGESLLPFTTCDGVWSATIGLFAMHESMGLAEHLRIIQRTLPGTSFDLVAPLSPQGGGR